MNAGQEYIHSNSMSVFLPLGCLWRLCRKKCTNSTKLVHLHPQTFSFRALPPACCDKIERPLEHTNQWHMKKPSGTKKGQLVIQGSTLSFKGHVHQGENAWKANQCSLTIWVNCLEDCWTSELNCWLAESPVMEVLYTLSFFDKFRLE